MDHDEWKQWMTEASSLLDGMDSEVTERVPDWATFRATFKQAGGAAETLQAETAAAQQQLAAAYRSEGALAHQVLRDAHACAKALLVAGRTAADEILAAARSDGDRAREEAKASAIATLRDAREKAEEAVASAERLAAQKTAEVRHEAEFMMEDARQKAGETVATAERAAAQKVAEAQHGAASLLEDAHRKAGEAVATAEREASQKVAEAQHDVELILEDAREKAEGAVATAEQAAAQKVAEAQVMLEDARQRADAAKSEAEQYVGNLIARMERVVPQQEELARAFQHLMQEYSTVVDTVGRVQTNARSEVIPRLHRLIAALKSGNGVEVAGDDVPASSGGTELGHAVAADRGAAADRPGLSGASSGPTGMLDPARRQAHAEQSGAVERVTDQPDEGQAHAAVSGALGHAADQPGPSQGPTELTGTVALEGASDALTDRFVEAMPRLPHVKRAVLATRWQVPRLAMIDVTIDGDSLGALDFSQLQEFTVRVTNTTQTMVVLRVEERVDHVDVVTSHSGGADHRS
ncbi:MAG TPA: hypothetical protein VEZ44_11080 [bacterium]|nr:hypothetical protein [bacterium]